MTVALPVRGARARGATRRAAGARRLSTKARIGALICALFVVAAIVGPMVAPYDPSAQSFAPVDILHAPSMAHLLGTTARGEDVLSQVLVGLRATLVLGLLTGLIATVLAVVVGISAGFLGGFWDELLSLLSNVFLVLPALPLLVVLIGYLPQRGQTSTILVLSLLGWPWGARVIRAQTLTLRGRDFVAASRETGERTWRVIFFEILPNEVSLIAASFVSTVLYAIGTSVALAFIGLTNFSQWSLGLILYWAQNGNALQLNAWWWFAPAGLCVALLGTGLVLLNFGIDEIGNPRLREAAGRVRIEGRAWRPADPTPVVRSGSTRSPAARPEAR
ncbi:MAG TPA: ABC transporter permease [Acidimicrobiales bacterium]|nr:ABC transporter permease [Acidimicrobiales bacterium]